MGAVICRCCGFSTRDKTESESCLEAGSKQCLASGNRVGMNAKSTVCDICCYIRCSGLKFLNRVVEL